MRILKFLMILLLLWLVLGQVGGVVVVLFNMFRLICSLVIKFGFAAGAIWIALRLIKKTEENDDNDD